MTTKKESKPEQDERSFFFPTLGVTVKARTEEEALKLAEAQKKEEDGDAA